MPPSCCRLRRTRIIFAHERTRARFPYEIPPTTTPARSFGRKMKFPGEFLAVLAGERLGKVVSVELELS